MLTCCFAVSFCFCAASEFCLALVLLVGRGVDGVVGSCSWFACSWAGLCRGESMDGHNGSAAAIYSKENLLNNVLSAIPSDRNRDEWIKASASSVLFWCFKWLIGVPVSLVSWLKLLFWLFWCSADSRIVIWCSADSRIVDVLAAASVVFGL
ncbi:putative protein phosphatase 2C 12 [Camellia lanceoleosa]|uniref:Uncharacterized protein n=1 Tax=Camellia lanceoleosa TaxID=1840588 RepID=A0ACC0IMT3_9ERIC|nr:putative protein phosphatase 2C 12 [Camellia lanceoleosa]